jgi:uncharacterized cupredoxin-like copper-binding protein
MLGGALIGAMRATLGLDSAQFEQGVKGVTKSSKLLQSSLAKLTAGLLAASTGVNLAIRRQLNVADDAGKAAQRIGLSVEALTQLRFAADLSGVSAQNLETSIQRLSRSMVGGNKAFKEIGVATSDAAGKMRPTEDVLLDLADVFQKMPDGAEKTALAIQLLGRSGAELIPLLNGGSASLRAMMGEADALGLTISTKTAKAAERFNDAITRVGAAVTGITRQITADLAPVMASIAELIAGVAARFADMNPSVRTAGTVLVGLTAAAGPAAVAVGTLIAGIRTLRLALLALAGPAGIAIAAAAVIGTIAVSAALAEGKTDNLSDAMRGTVEAASVLGTELGILSNTDLPTATQQTVNLANANLKLARTAFIAAEAEVAKAKAAAESLKNQVDVEAAFLPGVEPPSTKQYEEALGRLNKASQELRAKWKELEDSVNSGNQVTVEATEETQRLQREIDELKNKLGGGGRAARETKEEVEELAEGFGPVETAVGSLADAFGDFLSRGLTDFQSFADGLLGSFRQLISQMIAEAVKNKIVLNLGTAAVPGVGGAAGVAGTGFTGGLQSALSGGIGNFFNIGGNAAAAGGGIGATIGAAIGPLGLAAGLIGGILGARRRRRQAQQARQEANRQAREQQNLRIMELQGDTEEVRRRQLSDLRPGARRRQEEIFRLEDQKRVADERESIERRLLELQGETVELRRREVAQLDPANRALAERAFRLEDELRISAERESLEERLLQLQGNTEELRRRELETVDASNRSLLRQIFALEDFKATVDGLTSRLSGAFDLSTLEFGSAFEARLAQVAEARGYEQIAGVPARNLLPGNDPQLSAIEGLMKRTADTLDAINFYGIPGRA